MNDTDSNPSDDKLSALLQSARPMAELPPRFAAHVWRRLEQTEPRPYVFPGVLELLSKWFVTPRIAAPALAALVMLAVVAGAMRGVHVGNREARDRYVASVAPAYLQH
jgi:hypothetical protein